MVEVVYWVLIGAAVLAAVLALTAVIGSFLPRAHFVSRTLRTGRTPEAVWHVITDFAAVPTWHKEVVSVERLPEHDGRPVWRETYQGNYAIRLETTESVAPRRLVREIADESGPFRGRWQFDLAATDSGCRLTITESGEVANPFFRLMARLFMRPAVYLEEYLRALAGRLGEQPVLEGEENSATKRA